MTLARPDRLRAEQVASDGKRDLAVFDGRNISVIDADAGGYAQAAQPGALDDALGYFVRDLRMRMPLALLLTSRLPELLPATSSILIAVSGRAALCQVIWQAPPCTRL